MRQNGHKAPTIEGITGLLGFAERGIIMECSWEQRVGFLFQSCGRGGRRKTKCVRRRVHASSTPIKHVFRRRCLRCSCATTSGKLLKKKDWNLTLTVFATANVLCFPDAAYVYEASTFRGFKVHEKHCRLGPGACETPETEPYYEDSVKPWSEVNSAERAKIASMYTGVYGGLCLGIEASETCRPLLYWVVKVLEALGLDICIMPLFRYYWTTGHVVFGLDVQILALYIRGEGRWLTKEEYQIDDTTFVHPDLATKCSCLGQPPDIVNGTSTPDDDPVRCSEACRMKQQKIKVYTGIGMFIQLGPLILSGADIHVVNRESPTGESLTFSVDETPQIETCFKPELSIPCP